MQNLFKIELFYNQFVLILSIGKSSEELYNKLIMIFKKITSIFLLALVLCAPAFAINYDFSDKAQEEFERAEATKIPAYVEEPFIRNPNNQQKPQMPHEARKILSGNVVYIGAGTALDVVLFSAISSDSIQKNDSVTAQLNSDWIANNVIVAPQGSTITGVVTDAKSATWMMGNGQIGINFNQLMTPNGKVIQLATNKVFIVADSNRAAQIAKRTAIGMAGGLLFSGLAIAFGADAGNALTSGAITGATVGLVTAGVQKGEEINIPEGTALNIILSEPMTAAPYQ